MKFIDRVNQYREMLSQKKIKKQGIIDPRGTIENPEVKVPKMSFPEKTLTAFQKGLSDFGKWGANKITEKVNMATKSEPIKITFNQPKPTITPTITPTPFIKNNRIEPIVPQNIPKTYYTNRSSGIEPKLWDAITNASPTGDLQLNDYLKRMALALATQESGGGYQLEGDNGKSHGPYHIQRENVPIVDRYDPVASTKLVFAEMLRNMMLNNVPKERSLRTWNWNSGYNGNTGPKYNVDIPQMATTSSFYRR